MRYKKTTILLATAAMLAGGTQFAGAVPTLSLYDGTTTITVVDGGVGDSNPTVGAVTYNGSIGVWTVNVSTGITNPVTTGPYPHMDLNSTDATNSVVSNGAGTLTIKWSDTGNTASNKGMSLDIGGTVEGVAGASLVYRLYGDAANTALATTTLLGTDGPFGPGAFSQGGHTTVGLNTLGGNFSITEQIVITHTGNGNTSFDAQTQVVPDGGTTLALLGGSMLGLGAIRRRLVRN